ncbi:hypothetical protein KXS11_17695 [Plantibacter flavus]|uniref:hypothetical protein n=1 Tax=Plantibacter flavus TaxID=150123 RepID=UPI003F18247F
MGMRGIRPFVGLVVAGMALALVTGCTAGQAGSTATSAVASAEDSPTPTAASSSATADASDPETTFRTWLAASREPDPDTACALMTDALVQNMIAELAAQGVTVSSCAELITSSAALYASLGISADVDVTVLSESPDAAELDVVYSDGGDCGTVVLEQTGHGWVLNELSQECGTR